MDMVSLNARYFIAAMVMLSMLLTIFTISENAFPWTDCTMSPIQVVRPGDTSSSRQEYRGEWGLKAVNLCIENPDNGKRACYVTKYGEKPVENSLFQHDDPRIDIHTCKSNGNGIFGLIIFVLCIDIVCLPSFVSTTAQRKLPETVLRVMRASSVGGGMIFWIINIFVWSVGCHSAIKNVEESASLSAGFFLQIVALLIRFAGLVSMLKSWESIGRASFSFQESDEMAFNV